MTTNKSFAKYLWITAVIFVTYLFLGSFIVSKSLPELFYLITIYLTMLIIKLKK